MYELSLTAFVEGSDLTTACSVLSGLCGMPPWRTTHRVLYYQGSPKPNGMSNLASIEKPARKDAAILWKELHQASTRQSFIVQARYDVLKDKDFGAVDTTSLDSQQGVLRWTDFPDPPHGRPMIIQRKKVELWDQRNLPSILLDNNYQFKTETVEEVYRFYRDETEFYLSRQFFSRPIEDYTPINVRSGPPLEPLASLPPWESVSPVDAQNRWTLQVKAHVLQDNKPDEVKKAQDQLLAIRAELEGVFDFKSVDRKAQDTRVALQHGAQAAHQKGRTG